MASLEDGEQTLQTTVIGKTGHRMSQETVYDFEWDATKARSNERKHDVTFEEAASVFLDPLALTVYDRSSSLDEEHWFTLGFDARGRLLAVAHTYQITGTTSVRIRIISARKATRRERNYYEDQPDQVEP